MTPPPAYGCPKFVPFGQVQPLADFMGADWRGNMVTLPIRELAAWRLSVGRDDDPLLRSIEAVGLARPLWVAKTMDGRPVVISGGRRLAALRALGAESVPCLCPDIPFLGLLAISDNLGRGLNPAELALSWALTAHLADTREKETARRLLGIAGRDKRVPGLKAALRLPEEAFLAFASGRMDPEDAEAISLMPETLRDPATALILAAKASRRNRRRWLEWLSDIARIRAEETRAESARAENIKTEDMRSRDRLSELSTEIVGQDLLEAASLPDGEKLVTDRLLALRFPALTRLRSKRRELVKSLRLPEGLKLELDPELEDKRAELRLAFDSPSSLRLLANAASELSEKSEFERLWRDPDKWPPE